MDLPQDTKHLFMTWLEEEAVKATMHGSKSAMLYTRALDSLRSYKDPISDPKSLKKVRLIGDKIVQIMSAKLKTYCIANGYKVPESVKTPVKVVAARSRNAGDEEEADDEPIKKKRKTKKYVPAKRSGGYAILIVLFDNDPNRNGMRKEEIIRKAAPFSDKSFASNPSTNQFYSAWNSSKTLMKNDLIKCSGRPLYYYLTDEGLELAKGLKRAEGLNSSPAVARTSTPNKIDRSDGMVALDETDSDDDIDVSNQSLKDLYKSTREKKAVKPRGELGKLRASSELLFTKSGNTFGNNKYEIWDEGSFQIIMIIDNREVRSQQQREFFPQKLADLKILSDTRALSVGDGLWIAKHKTNGQEVVLDFIFERKRLDDLASSIKDGRHSEQKVRLKRTGITNVYYVVEEEMGTDVSKMGEAIKTSVAMTITTSKFYIKKTRDADETVAFFARLTKQIKEYYLGKKLLVIKTNNLESQLDYGSTLNKFKAEFKGKECVYPYDVFQSMMSKTDLITVKEMFIKMLMTVRGLSLQKAIVIQKIFPTPRKLIQSYNKLGDDNEKKTFLARTFKDEVGSRKIGPVLSEKVYDVWGKFHS